MFFANVIQLIGLITSLKGIISAEIYSLLGVVVGALLMYLGYKIEREYIKNE